MLSHTPERERSEVDGTDSQMSENKDKKHRSLVVERKRKISTLQGNDLSQSLEEITSGALKKIKKRKLRDSS